MNLDTPLALFRKPEHRLGANLGLLIPCAHGENLQKLVKVAALLNPEGL